MNKIYVVQMNGFEDQHIYQKQFYIDEMIAQEICNRLNKEISAEDRRTEEWSVVTLTDIGNDEDA